MTTQNQPITFGELRPGEAAMLLGGVAVAASLAFYLLKSGFSGTFALSRFIDPTAVKSIAGGLSADEDEFILDAWDIAGRQVTYEAYGSTLHFGNAKVRCQNCLLPAQVARKKVANCVGKSALLTSLLRTRLSPDRVYMGVGRLNRNGVGGHAWVEVQRSDGEWYVLEATSPPLGWVPQNSVSSQYVVEAMVNDKRLSCFEKDVCLLVTGSCCDHP